jgi:hypothetical protein
MRLWAGEFPQHSHIAQATFFFGLADRFGLSRMPLIGRAPAIIISTCTQGRGRRSTGVVSDALSLVRSGGRANKIRAACTSDDVRSSAFVWNAYRTHMEHSAPISCPSNNIAKPAINEKRAPPSKGALYQSLPTDQGIVRRQINRALSQLTKPCVRHPIARAHCSRRRRVAG